MQAKAAGTWPEPPILGDYLVVAGGGGGDSGGGGAGGMLTGTLTLTVATT